MNLKKVIAFGESLLLFGSVFAFAGCNRYVGFTSEYVSGESNWYDATSVELENPYSIEEVGSVFYSGMVYTEDAIYVLASCESNYDVSQVTSSDFNYNDYLENSILKYDFEGNFLDSLALDESFGSDYCMPMSMTYDGTNIDVSVMAAEVNGDEISCSMNGIIEVSCDSFEVVDAYTIDVESNGLSQMEYLGDFNGEKAYFVYEYDELDNYYCKFVFVNRDEVTNVVDICNATGRTISFTDCATKIDDDTIALDYYTETEMGSIKYTVSTGNFTFQDFPLNTSGMFFEKTQDSRSFAVDSRGIWYINSQMQSKISMSFASANINVFDASRARVISATDDTFVLFSSIFEESAFPRNVVLVLKKAESNPNEGKKILNVYSATNSISYAEAEAVVEFNNSNDEFMVIVTYSNFEVFDYGDETYEIDNQISEELKSKFYMLDSGSPAVVINASRFSQFNNDEYFMDLTPFMNGSNGINRGEYFENILDAASYNGALYQLPLSISVSGIVVNSSDIREGQTGFTYEEYPKFLEEVCNGVSPFETTKNQYVIDSLALGYINYLSNSGVDFNSEEFRNLAAFVDENIVDVSDAVYSNGDEEGNGPYFDEMIFPYHMLSTFYNADCGLRLCGIPSPDGASPYGKVLSSAAITSYIDEETANAAWEFIKIMLGENVQSKETSGFPVNRNAFNTVIHNEIDEANENYRSFTALGLSEIQLRSYGMNLIDESAYDVALGIIEGVDSIYSGNTIVSYIVAEEIGGYFAGQKTIDAVIIIMNDRITTMLNEG